MQQYYYIILCWKQPKTFFTLSRAVFFYCPHSVNLEPWPLMHACTIPEAVLYTNCSLKSPVPFLFLSSLFPSVPPSRPCFCYYLCWSSHGVFYDFLLLLFFVITLPTWNFKPWHSTARSLRIHQTLQPVDLVLPRTEGEKEECSDSGSLPSLLTQNTHPVSCTGNPVWRTAWLLGLARGHNSVFACVRLRNNVAFAVFHAIHIA